MKGKRVIYGMAIGLALGAGATSVRAQCVETEGNDTKAAANLCTLGPAGTITGNSILATGAGVDYYKVKTSPLPLAIYRHTLTLTSNTVGHSASIRGLSQVNVPNPGPNTPGTEISFQAHMIPTGTTSRVTAWYGFGKEEEHHYRVAGTAATTANYTSTLATSTVTPFNAGVYDVGPDGIGSLTISTVGQTTTDTDMWIYDGNLNAMPGYGNDDEPAGATLQSKLTRNFTPGTYYIAMSRFETGNNQVSPEDDDFQTGLIMEFPNIIVNNFNNTGVALDVDFTIAVDAVVGFTSVGQVVTPGAFGVYWATFTVIPEPASLSLLAMGALALIRRRRA